MIYAYCRVSTRVQLDNNSLEQQKQEIQNKYKGVEVVFYQEQFTGAKLDRPIFNELLMKLTEGDVLVVSKLDRLARNTVEGIAIVRELFNRGVSVHVLNVGILENTPMGNFFLTTLLAVAEMERSMIIERTQQGKLIAKQTNPDYKEGRPRKFNPKKVEEALNYVEMGNSYNKASEIYGISKTTLIRRMQERKAKAELGDN